MDSVELVKQICKDRKIPISKLERDCDFSNGYIRRLKEGKFPSDRLKIIADYLNVSTEYLLTGNESSQAQDKAKQERHLVPVLGRVAAGIPIEAVEEILDWEEISDKMASLGEYFALRIQGDSMEPKMSNGDVVIVKRQEYAEDGDYVIALINGNDATCKKLKKYEDGIALVSNNPAYPPMYFSCTDVDNVPVVILGKVMELRSKF